MQMSVRSEISTWRILEKTDSSFLPGDAGDNRTQEEEEENLRSAERDVSSRRAKFLRKGAKV